MKNQKSLKDPKKCLVEGNTIKVVLENEMDWSDIFFALK